MTATEIASLKALHRQLGELFHLGRLLAVTIAVMGSLFTLLTVFMLKAVHHPETLLHAQGYLLNYKELHALEASSASQPPRFNDLQTSTRKPTDPNWDGALAGGSLGFNLGQNVPVIGLIGGPLLGAILGYELDKQL